MICSNANIFYRREKQEFFTEDVEKNFVFLCGYSLWLFTVVKKVIFK